VSRASIAGEFLGGEFDAEHVDVLDAPLRLGRLRDH
jgi:hypothetical protein